MSLISRQFTGSSRPVVGDDRYIFHMQIFDEIGPNRFVRSFRPSGTRTGIPIYLIDSSLCFRPKPSFDRFRRLELISLSALNVGFHPFNGSKVPMLIFEMDIWALRVPLKGFGADFARQTLNGSLV